MSRVLVIGGGIAGGAVALALRDRDLPVTVVERSSPADGSPGDAPSGSPAGRATAASGGMLAPQYEMEGDTPLFDLALESRALQPSFLSRVERLSGRDLGFRRQGMLVANATPEEDRVARATAGRHRDRGLRAEVVGAEEARRLQPGLTPAASWLWLPDEAQVDSQRLSSALPRALVAAGAELLAGTTVSEILGREGRATGVALADGRTLDAEHIVVAAGAWSGELRGLPAPLPVRPVRGQILRYRPLPAPVQRLLADHRGRYLVPRADGSLLAGSTMEEAGWEVSVTGEGEAWIREGAAGLHDGLGGVDPADRWAGLRPITADGAPILGEDPEMEGLHYATGYGRNGILVAAAAAERIVSGITGNGEARTEPAFAPDRFDRVPGGRP